MPKKVELTTNESRAMPEYKIGYLLGYSGHCTDDDCGLYTCNEDNECPRCGAYFIFHTKNEPKLDNEFIRKVKENSDENL